MTTLTVHEREATLLDVLDRLLDKGVVVAGDLTLSVAEVDLIFASLRLVVTSVDKMWETQNRPSPRGGIWQPPEAPGDALGLKTDLMGDCAGDGRDAREGSFSAEKLAEQSEMRDSCPPSLTGNDAQVAEGEGLDPDKVANGLVKLVLTLVELLRKLLEREALRRMERGTLAPWEVERLGQAFLRMEQKTREIKDAFHLSDEDLNLDLGPLGKLM